MPARRPVVVTKVYGGLGNQMFQYAAGLALARRLGAAHYVDTLWFDPRVHPDDAPPRRRYGLDGFGIESGVPRPVRLRLRLRRPTVVTETSFTYQSELESVEGDVILDGYWQSYRYFEQRAGDVRDALRFPAPVSPAAQRLLGELDDTPAASLHVRRGDYASNPKLTRKHGVLPSEYYETAAAELRRRRGPRVRFFVFSDDIAWCKDDAGLAGLGDLTFVEGTAADIEDMLLMSRCRDHVVANSAFSWWGAWLGTADDKVVVAPSRWFADPAIDTRDLVPSGWLRI